MTGSGLMGEWAPYCCHSDLVSVGDVGVGGKVLRCCEEVEAGEGESH